MKESQPVVESVPRTRHIQMKRKWEDTVKPNTETKTPKSTRKNENLPLNNPIQTTIRILKIKTE